jgi:hypothetical protein
MDDWYGIRYCKMEPVSHHQLLDGMFDLGQWKHQNRKRT